MERNECENYELEKEGNFCSYFTGNVFSKNHTSECYKYCSYWETRGLIQNDVPLKSAIWYI